MSERRVEVVREGEDVVLGLNRSEKVYLAIEGIGGSLNQVYALRFVTQHSVGDMKRAFREVVRAHPRLRAVVDRTLFGHRLRLRAEGPTIDVLSDLAFQVWEHEDTSDAAVSEHLGVLLNEPFAVERDLPIRARFLPHPRRPMLILTLHHLAGDGRTYVGVIQDLMKVLDGQTLAPVPVHPPGYGAATLPRAPGAILAALFAGLTAMLARRRDRRRPLRLPRRWIDGFSPVATLPLRLRCSGAQLVAAARARGATVNGLVFAALARALRASVPEGEQGPVRGRLSLDLRSLFPEGREPVDGNYVSSFLVDVDPELALDAMVPLVHTRTQEGIRRFHDRHMLLPGLLDEVSTWLGRKLLGRVALSAKLRDRLPPQSFHFSNLGRMDGLNAFGPQLDALFPCLPHHDLFLGLIGFGDGLCLTASYPRGEIAREQVQALLGDLDRILGEVVAADATPGTAEVREEAA